MEPFKRVTGNPVREQDTDSFRCELTTEKEDHDGVALSATVALQRSTLPWVGWGRVRLFRVHVLLKKLRV